MRQLMRYTALFAVLGLLAFGCSQSTDEEAVQGGSSPLFVSAPGQDALGDVGISLPSATGIVIGGVGLRGAAPASGTIMVDVPGTPVLALVYWEGQYATSGTDNQISIDVNGTSLTATGMLIGGITEFFSGAYSSVHRYELDPGLLSAGMNTIDVSGMDFTRCTSAGSDCRNNGVGVVVLYDDGSTPVSIDFKDGLDLAFYQFDPPLDTTVPQEFSFGAMDMERSAKLYLLASSVAPNRPNIVKVTYDAGGMEMFVDPFGNTNGPDYDAIELELTIPASASVATVQCLSEKAPSSELDGLPASLAWMVGAVAVPGQPLGCRVTGGLVDESGNCVDCPEGSSGTNRFTAGGQAGANTALPPQPSGNWTHRNHNGPAGQFTFHAGTPSAPEGTEIDWITCMDPDNCDPAREAPAKQIDFGGVGTFKNMRHVPDIIKDNVMVGKSLHWFEVNIDDLGEPGKAGKQDPPADMCPPDGFGMNAATEFADCDCPDFYRIRIYSGPTSDSAVIYEASGYIKGGNFQIHPLTGYDRN